jgi:hypothetical protein
MNAHEIFSQPFTQVTLPILIGFFIATVSQNRRMDDLKNDLIALRASMESRFASMETRFDMVMGKLSDVDTRLSVLEDRVKR